MMTKTVRTLSLCLAFAALPAFAAEMAGTLAAPSSFASISDPAARSAAYFTEAAKVMMHPRCVNCHPAGDRPSQGEGAMSRLHQPPVTRGADGFGSVAMRCASCHQKANFDPGHMPGHEHWHLAPLSMAWQGKTASQICAQVKDPARNGNRNLAQIVEHMSKDTLVGWAWAPGVGRQPAPGTQAELGALLEAWVQTGAACPAS
jgi:hypothetical protein